jgi:hypothetical protein
LSRGIFEIHPFGQTGASPGALRRGYFYRDDIPVAAAITVVGLSLLVWLAQRDGHH